VLNLSNPKKGDTPKDKMKSLLHVLPAAVLAAFLLPASLAEDAYRPPATIVSVSGSTVRINNPVGVLLPTFAEKITGSPDTVSIVIKGCVIGDTIGDNCNTLETNTSTATPQIRTFPTNTTAYDYFLVIPSWTGGTSPTVTVRATLPPYAKNGGSSGGTWGSITGTLSAQTDLNSALNLLAPIASPTFTGTATAANIIDSGVGASLPVCTDGSKQFITAACGIMTTSTSVLIGSTTPNSGVFSGLTLTNVATGTQCLRANSSGVISGTGADCSPGVGTVTSFSAGDFAPLVYD
jgi:hypothetical protein